MKEKIMYKILIVGLLWSFVNGVAVAEDLLIESKIINGTVVSVNDDEWRFIVSLKYNGNAYCGGSLVAPNWVLTAAHCLYGYTPDAYDSVGVGSYNLNTMTEYGVKQFIIHPSYNPTTMDNDIGLIELDKSALTVATIPYDISSSLAVNTQTKVAGWGTMTEGSYDIPDDLMEALTPIVDFDKCNSAYGGAVTNNMICAGYWVSTRDSCQGDSGGPLIVDNTLVGIVSWGNGCAEDGYPGIYTRVQNYAQWLKSYVPYVPKKTWAPIMMDEITTFVPIQQ